MKTALTSEPVDLVRLTAADQAADRIRHALTEWPSQSLIDAAKVRDLLLDLLSDLRPLTTIEEF